ncbi:UDP-glucose 4-epimerase GalE [Microvirga zambiensis]|uniref:UDP-glucose 4-epimerase GalE n=1 Tax=Microvirga zambiensis TaxID=1402137 RepID=UPI00191EE841|nr:UDP-glucose 4-epimerase GalE [Microvirga zambiensis]
MSRTRILVTGGAGYIGSHTCKALAQNGFDPVAYDNLIAGHRDAVRWGPLAAGDILDREALVETLRRYDPAAVIHFAAHAYVGESVTEPAKYYRNNVLGTQTLLDACRGAGLLNVIFSSSCATYGIPESLPIREDSPQDPINPYGRSKLIGEQMLADYAAAYGMRYVALRYFNACGADPGGEIGERHDPETHLIPRALMAAAGRLSHLSVFGDDYPTPDGTCIRDYIHVSDLAKAHVAAVLHLLKGGENLAANLGTGRGISIKEILTAIEQVTGRQVPVRFEPRRAGDPPILFANPSLARENLGFKADLSDVDTIIRTAARFFNLEARS